MWSSSRTCALVLLYLSQVGCELAQSNATHNYIRERSTACVLRETNPETDFEGL